MSDWSAQDLFYDKMIADPRVNFFFEGIDMKKQRAHQVCPLHPSLHLHIDPCCTLLDMHGAHEAFQCNYALPKARRHHPLWQKLNERNQEIVKMAQVVRLP